MKKIIFEPSVFLGMLAGHLFLLITGASYLTAWVLNYGQIQYMATDISKTFFSISAGSGFISMIWLFFSVRSLARAIRGKKINIMHIILAGSAFFTLAWAGTYWGLQRKFTIELLLVVIWAVFEFCVVYVCFHFQWFNKLQSNIIMTLIGISLITGLVCYIIHFKIKGMARSINGMIPYGIISITVIIIFTIYLLNFPALSGNLKEK